MNRRTATATLRVVSVLAIASSVAFHLWTSIGSLRTVNSDEVMATLMVRDFRSGHPTVFYWGQEYGGTLEVFALALVGASIGDRAAFHVVPILVTAAIGLLTWRMLRRHVDPTIATIVGAAVTFFPPFVPWIAGRPLLFYGTTVLLGLLMFALAGSVVSTGSRRAACALGAVAGVAWWTTFQSLFFIIPVVFWLGWARRSGRRVHPGVLSVGFTIGALPWIVRNARTGFDSLTDTPPATGSLRDRLIAQVTDGWPTTFGLRSPLTLDWLHDSLKVVAPLIAGAVVVGAVVAIRRRAAPLMALVAVLPVFAVLQTLAPTGGYVGSGRYYLFVGVSVVVLVFVVVDAIHGRRPGAGVVAAAVVTVAMLASTTVSLARLDDRQLGPTETASVIDLLDEAGIDHVYGDYWIVYVLAFEDDGLVVSPVSTDRQPRWTREVEAAERTAWVFWLDYDVDAARLTRVEPLLAANCDVERRDAGRWVVLLPDCNLPPADLGIT